MCRGWRRNTKRGDHSSRSRITSGLQQPTRGSEARLLRATSCGPGRPSPPIWPCSTRGFPCPGCCHPGGGLLPHLFTLTQCARPKEAGPWCYRRPAAEVQAHRRFIFCGTFRSRESTAAHHRRKTQPPGVTRRVAQCPSMLADANRKGFGVRTFLPPRPFDRDRRSPGSSATSIISRISRE